MISQFFVSGSSVAMILTMAIFLTQQFDSTLALVTPKPSARRTRNPTFVPSQKPTITPSVVPTVTPQPTFVPTTTPAPTFTHSPSTFRPSFPTSQPSTSPSGQPTGQPSRKPSSQPTRQPTGQPSCQPTSNPSSPTGQPSRRPSSQPTRQPYSQPSSQPTGQPTRQPTGQPSRQPSCQPSSKPTQPTGQPTSSPTNPTGQPSSQPTNPTGQPTGQPSRQPSTQPTGQPSRQPSTQPTGQPTGQPSRQPTGQPSRQPSSQPSRQPSAQPSTQPTRQPTGQPTGQPSRQPTRQPTGQPSRQPSGQPSSQPSRQPTSNPTNPTSQPSNQPTGQPSRQPTTQPTCQPTSNPTNPTGQPSSEPTSPTGQPTRQPTGQPSRQPTSQPSLQPTSQPSSQPSRPTLRPTTLTPSAAPSGPTRTPTRAPTTTALPTAPSFKPTPAPSAAPTYAYHTQRYESVSSESFALFTPLWTGSHGSWLNIDPNGAYCEQFDSVPSYPVCVDGFLIPDAFTYKQKGSVPCPAVQCIKKVVGVNNCSYTPSDTFDYLPPAPTTTLDSDTICAAPSEDSYFSPGTLTLDQGIPPFFTPVTPVKLNIRGVVTAQLRDKCLPVENAEIIAWQVDPTALEKFTIESQRKHQLHDTNSGDDNNKEQQNQDIPDRNDYAQSNVSSYTSLRDISCRGMQHSSANGSYVFHTLMPPSYGPPRHIMFTISAPGYATLTTRMYFGMDWRLQQLTTLHGEENTRIVDSPHIDLNLLNTSRSADTEYAFPGRVANDPRVAHVIFARNPSSQSLLVTGSFETVFNFVLSPLRADTAPPQDTSDMPPIDISGLWSEPSGGLVKVETTGITFIATQYPHPRSWVSVVGAIAGDTIRGVDFHQVTGSQSDKLFSGETYTPPTTLWTSGSSTGVIVPDDAFATEGFTPTQPLAVSLSWSGGGYDAVWSKVSGSAQNGFRFVKLLVTRETGGYAGGQLVINEIEIFEGILTERQQPRVKMTTPRFPAPQMVSCSTFSEQSKHCWRAFDGDVGANSAWVTKSVGSKDHILSSPQWITIDFGEGHSVQPTGLRIVCDAEHTAHPQGCPMTFSLLGSQDNKKFDVLFKTDMFDYANSYSNGGQMFYFLPEHSAGRMNQQRCGSCDSGPHFTCHIQAYDGTCNSKYCNLDGKCDEVPPCIAGEYMDFKFTSYTKPSFSCKQCAPGRFGNTSDLISSYCSGLCTEGYYCPAGSTSATAQPCGGAHLFCPEGSGAPIQAAAGRATRNRNTSLVFNADKLDVVTQFATQSFEVLCSPGSYCVKGVAVPCPVGRFGNQTGLQTAQCSGDCNAGDYCPLGSVEPTQCEEGYYCSDGRTKTICPAGTYGSAKGLRDRTCTGLCSPGFYCEEGSVSPTSKPCPSGRYGSTAGLTTSQCSGLCEAGYFCTSASTRSTMHLCGGDDVYCPAGSEAPLMVDKGYYSTGGTENTHSSQTLCEVGFYATDGVKKSCPAGTFGNRTGLTFDVVIPDFTTSAPSPNPSRRPTHMPTFKPTFRHDPTSQPSSQPSGQPTSEPTSHSKPSFPTSQPSRQPTTQPTGQPSRQPTSQPSAQPSCQPGSRPTSLPSRQPTGQPTRQPTGQPSRQPTSQPSKQPTAQPSLHTFVSKRPTTPRPSAKPTQIGGTFQPTSTPSFADWTKLPTMRPTTIEEGPLINILCSGQCTAGYYCPLNSTRSTQVPCPMGRYGSTSGLQNERCTGVCPLGHYCPLAATKPIPCPPGVFGNLTGLVDASCSDQCWLGGCSPNLCQQGFFCPLGSIAATQYSCGGVDVYCPTGSAAPTPVTEGYYTIGPFPKQSAVNRIAQVKCEVGHYCTGGVKSKCPPGVFGATEGLTTAVCSGVCPRGFYCPEGTSNGTTFRCPAGRYGATTGLSDTSCSGTCSAGFHCPEASTSPTQLECAVFTKQTLPQTTFAPAMDGSYVTYLADLNTSTVVLPNSDIVVTALVNPNNVYCPEGSSYPLIVRPGYYTTGQNATTRFNQFPCPMGTYCVDGVINDCPAGRYGRAERLTTRACSGPCARGHYCPSASTTSTQRPCPVGRFGSVEGLSTPSCSGACLHPEQCSIGSVIAQPLVTV